MAFEQEADKLIETSNQGNKWDVMYNVACAYAVAAAVRPADADRHATRAVALLNELAKTYYFRVPQRVAHLDKDTDLDSLRDRDDYKAFERSVKNASAVVPVPR